MPKLPALLGIAFILLIGTGCARLPVAGPLTSEIVENKNTSSPAHIDYLLIDVTDAVTRALANRPFVSFSGSFGAGGPPPDYTIGIGDVLSVTIWEAGPGGLFSNPVPLNQASASSRGGGLPELVVAQDGGISVPYVGRITVTGKRPPTSKP